MADRVWLFAAVAFIISPAVDGDTKKHKVTKDVHLGKVTVLA